MIHLGIIKKYMEWVGAKGPFLSTGDEIRWNFTINREEDVRARLLG